MRTSAGRSALLDSAFLVATACRLWNPMASHESQMPSQNVLPIGAQ